MIEIKFIGRGGQGAKSAAAILAEAALEKGKHIQSFPEFGAERQGAPVFAYTRIDDREIRVHSGVSDPDIIVVLDPTLMNLVDPSDKCITIVNTSKDPGELKTHHSLKGKVYSVDATKISLDLFGKNIPNTPMLGAVEKAASLVTLDTLKQKISDKFIGKIGPEGVNKNIQAIERAYNEMRS